MGLGLGLNAALFVTTFAFCVLSQSIRLTRRDVTNSLHIHLEENLGTGRMPNGVLLRLNCRFVSVWVSYSVSVGECVSIIKFGHCTHRLSVPIFVILWGERFS